MLDSATKDAGGEKSSMDLIHEREHILQNQSSRQDDMATGKRVSLLIWR